MTFKLSGIVPPLVTPLFDDGRVDIEGLERLVEHVIAGGVSGLFVLGTTAEAPSLSYAIRRDIIDLVCKQVAGRIPILAGITDTAMCESVGLARHAAAAGVQAVVVAPPYYYPMTQSEFIVYLRKILDDLPLPAYVYNMPGCVKLHLEVDTVRRVMDHPKVSGLKDSSGNMTYFHQVRSALAGPDQSLLVGPEELLAESVLFGSDGGVNGGANMFPELYVALYEAARVGDLKEVSRLQSFVMQINLGIYGSGTRASRVISGIKATLHSMGICNDAMAMPFKRLDAGSHRSINELIGLVSQAVGRSRSGMVAEEVDQA